jgi:leader peptidase (prepilin peptidase)/N-methyltransferase
MLTKYNGGIYMVGSKKLYVNLFLSILAFVLLLVCCPNLLTVIKGFTFAEILLFASNSDIEIMEVSDSVHVMILITAFIGIVKEDILSMVLGLILIPLPLLIVSLTCKNSFGGADIKIMAACSFLLGLERGLVAIIVGLTVAIITTIIIKRIQKKDLKEVFPIMPYLAIGCFLAYLI